MLECCSDLLTARQLAELTAENPTLTEALIRKFVDVNGVYTQHYFNFYLYVRLSVNKSAFRIMALYNLFAFIFCLSHFFPCSVSKVHDSISFIFSCL